jgi:hypothetical protein
MKLAACLLALAVVAQQTESRADTLRILQVQPGFYMIAGAGGNIAVQTGPDGVVLVDSGSAPMAHAVLAAIKTLTDQPIRYIINTSADADHVGGNATLAMAGQSLFVAGNGGASIVGTENLSTSMSARSGAPAPFPTVVWPTETYSRKQKTLYLNNEGIQVIYQPAAVGCVHAFANVSGEPVRWLETFAPQPPAEDVFRFMAVWEQNARELEG